MAEVMEQVTEQIEDVVVVYPPHDLYVEFYAAEIQGTDCY